MTRLNQSFEPLVDSFGRVHTSLRMSVTDRCNIRCSYCMPEFNAEFMPRSDLLTFEELIRVARLLVERCGINDLRLTGGEPLVRRELDRLIMGLSQIEGIEDLSLTTNGILLREQAAKLRAAGLRRLNISLDTLDREVFKKLARRDFLAQTLDGIDAAIECGFDSIKLNTIAIRGVTETEVIELIQFAIQKRVTIRFIEFMPLDFDHAWRQERVLRGDDLLRLISEHFGELIEKKRSHPSQPAERFALPGVSDTEIGIIRSVSAPFCEACNRLRITADGSVRNCLFAKDELRLRDVMRSGATDDELIARIRECVQAKRRGHGIDSIEFTPPDRPMHSIGG